MTTSGTIIRPLLLLAAGVLGMAGVGLAAAASHLADGHPLGNASTMCLAHAPALVALAASLERFRTAPIAGVLLGIGTLLFAGDLLYRHYNGTALFPMAAPAGGMTMMAGWLAVGLGFISGRREA